MASFEADITGYDEGVKFMDMLTNDAVKRYGTYLEKLGIKIVATARSNLQNAVHVQRGDLLASIQLLESIEGKEILVGSLLVYADYIENGRPEVKPVQAKVLHWVDNNGNDVFSKKSKATKPTYFMLSAVLEEMQGLPRLWVDNETKFLESIT